MSVTLTGPAGWTVRATSAASAPSLPAGGTLRTGWRVTAPAGTPPARTASPCARVTAHRRAHRSPAPSR
ncbi:NEW3 domain-containing protein [Streptomyces tricolor]|nr:NEW3 domain-containing protein [Streptomyces tricolor]